MILSTTCCLHLHDQITVFQHSRYISSVSCSSEVFSQVWLHLLPCIRYTVSSLLLHCLFWIKVSVYVKVFDGSIYLQSQVLPKSGSMTVLYGRTKFAQNTEFTITLVHIWVCERNDMLLEWRGELGKNIILCKMKN